MSAKTLVELYMALDRMERRCAGTRHGEWVAHQKRVVGEFMFDRLKQPRALTDMSSTSVPESESSPTIIMSAPVFKPASIEARVELINGNFNLPDASVDAMKHVREILSDAAHKLLALSKDATVDQGTLVRAIQKLQATKDVACQAFILPFYEAPKESN